MISKMTPSSKPPIRNPQRPPSPQLMLPQPNHVGFPPNFQDIFKIIFQDDPWCQRWSHPPSLQSGTFNVLQAPNLGFISQIMFDLGQTFRIGPLPSTIIIFEVELYPILQVSSQEPSTSFKPPCNQKLILSRSLAKLSFLHLYSKNLL